MDSNIKRILVIGGTGMLGKPVAQRLARDGFDVTVMSTAPEKHKDTFSSEIPVVYGDVTMPETLRGPIDGNEAVYLNLNSHLDERLYHAVEIDGARNVANIAKELGVRRIGMISSATSSGELNGKIYLDAKVHAERAIQESGIPYHVMRPSWFFESLPLFFQNGRIQSGRIQKGRAIVIGKQPLGRHWLSADDYAAQVSRAFQSEETINKCYYNYGATALSIPSALERYCQLTGAGLSVKTIPFSLAKLMSFFPGKSALKAVIGFFKFLESWPELGDSTETDNLLGKNSETLEQWFQRTAR